MARERKDDYTPAEMEAYARSRNEQKNRHALRWLRLHPKDNPDQIVGIDPNTNKVTGPVIYCGRRYKIFYKEPMILPFNMPGEGSVVMHVAELEGNLDKTGIALLDTKAVLCAPNDYSVKGTGSADRSVFWLCRDDRIEEVNNTKTA